MPSPLGGSGRWRENQQVLNDFHKEFRAVVRRVAKEAPSLLDGKGNATVTIHDLRRSAVTSWSKSVNIQTVNTIGHPVLRC